MVGRLQGVDTDNGQSLVINPTRSWTFPPSR